MALTYLGGKTTTQSLGGKISIVTTYNANKEVTHETVTHRHTSTGMTFVFEYGSDSGGGGATQSSVVTGVDPSQIDNALYGRIIPLTAIGDATIGGGLVRIGTAGLIFGPYFSGDTAARVASFAVSFGFPANPEGTRRVYEIALDGKIAWELAAGSPEGVLNPAGFLGDLFQCRFYAGTMTQGADPLEAAMFGAQSVAYRPQMMLWITDLPVTPFDGKVPFVSCKIGDVTGGAVAGDGINLGSCLEAIAYSPWLEYDSSSFETTGVADIVQGMILTEDQSFLDLLRVTGRVYRTLDILQTDMLRVNDRGATVAPDVVLHRDHISAAGGVQYSRAEEASVARELELTTIDPDADYIFMPFKVARPLAPVPVTSSVAKETITLPVVIDASTRASLVTYAKYEEDNARKRLSLQTMLYGYALEPGDLFRLIDIADGFDNSEVWKVVESSHGANYINEISAEAILKCAIGFEEADPYFADVILLLHANAGPPAIDHSPYAEPMSMLSGVQIDTTIQKFGAASFLFDGTNDVVQTTITHQIWWDISPTNTSPYTVELWARFAQLPRVGTTQTLICRNSGFLGRLFQLYVPAGTDELTWATGSPATSPSFTETLATAAANLLPDTWYHIAVDKDSTGTVRIYVNGVMKASETPADSRIANSVADIQVGNDDDNDAFDGNIDDVRITKRSRYGDLYGNASFTVPSFQFPDSA